MNMGYTVLLNKIRTDISQRHDCDLRLAFMYGRGWKLGQWQEFTSAGGGKITLRSVVSLTLSRVAANVSGFSLASLLFCATELSCSNVITSTILAIPGQSTPIKEAFQHRSVNNLKRDLSLTCDKQVHILPAARWHLQLPGVRCFGNTFSYLEGQSPAVSLC